MPSVSKAQRRLMGMAYAYKKGKLKNASDAVKKLAKSMKLKDLKDFAKTSEEDLPDYANEQFQMFTDDMAEEQEIDDELEEQSWEGTTKAMKKHSEIDNPFALVNYMKNKGYKPHYNKKGKKMKEELLFMPMYKRINEQKNNIERFNSNNFKGNVNDFKSSSPLLNKLGFKKDFSIYLSDIDDRRGWLYYISDSLKDYAHKNQYIAWTQAKDPFGRSKIIFYIKEK